jgi:hypothetical protein
VEEGVVIVSDTDIVSRQYHSTRARNPLTSLQNMNAHFYNTIELLDWVSKTGFVGFGPRRDWHSPPHPRHAL